MAQITLTPGSFLVAITGGGLYNSGFDYNSAALLRDALPNFIARETKPDIQILKYPHDIPSVYAAVRDIFPTLWNGSLSVYDSKASTNETVNIGLMVHMGMRTSEDNYCFETVARRDGYKHADMENGTQPDGDGEPGGYWEGCPAELVPDVPVTEAAEALKKEIPDSKTRVSTNAGHNLCEFMFYSSLAELYKRNEKKRVVFVHIPSGDTKEQMDEGVKVLTSYIRNLVERIE